MDLAFLADDLSGRVVRTTRIEYSETHAYSTRIEYYETYAYSFSMES